MDYDSYNVSIRAPISSGRYSCTVVFYVAGAIGIAALYVSCNSHQQPPSHDALLHILVIEKNGNLHGILSLPLDQDRTQFRAEIVDYLQRAPGEYCLELRAQYSGGNHIPASLADIREVSPSYCTYEIRTSDSGYKLVNTMRSEQGDDILVGFPLTSRNWFLESVANEICDWHPR